MKLKDIAINLFETGIKSVLPENFIPDVLHAQSPIAGPAFILAVGKASVSMAEETFFFLKNRGIDIVKTLAIAPHGYKGSRIKEIEVIFSAHPVPDKSGLVASKRTKELLTNTSYKTLIFCLSGGASSLLPSPVEGITMKNKIMLTHRLLKSGADITEINKVRIFFSDLKGGGLLRYVNANRVLGIILSDVMNDPVGLIGSGPTVPAPRDPDEVEDILKKYNLYNAFEENFKKVKRIILARKEEERIKKDTLNLNNIVAANNKKALSAMKKQADKLGFETKILSDSAGGMIENSINWHISEINRILDRTSSNRICLLSGGETTVVVKGSGIGGRNTEFALRFAISFKSRKNWQYLLLSSGSDGIDANTDAAGAFVTENTITVALKKGLDPLYYLNNNDSYSFFEKMDALFKPGPTGTNVMDLRVFLFIRKSNR